MYPSEYHRLTAQQAVAWQQTLRGQTQLIPLTHPVTTIGGADISYNRFSDVVYAGIVVLSFPQLQVLDEAWIVGRMGFPYVPGLLAFREMPSIIEVWEKLSRKPDVLVFDGQGTAHPRRMGIATHFGIVANWPTVGCAKSLLTGKYEEPAPDAGSVSDLIAPNGEKIGEVLRAKAKTNPVFISPGNLITQNESTELMLRCARGYRVPEPTRLAHLLVNRVRVENKTA